MSESFGEFDVSQLPGQYYQHTFDDLPLRAWPQQLVPGQETPQLHLVASEGALVEPDPKQYRLGEDHLPIAPYRQHYLQTIAENQKVVVSANTGTGKSTNLPLFLLENGAPIIYVSEPRILSTRELKDRARQNLGERYEHLVGNLTGNAAETDCPPDARLVYVTQDLLFKMASRGLLPPDAHIILDEAHEKGSGLIFLLDVVQELVDKNPDMRLTVTSATIDEDKFSAYLKNAPILRLPGQTHDIEESQTTEKVGTAMRYWMKRPQNKNVLGFEPGTSRMRRTADTAQSRMHDHKVHRLYGDQSPREQKEALNPADKNHIVATRVGENSITPDNKDVVVDSTLSHIGSFKAGVQVLSTEWSSKATMKQRRGRVGRTKKGFYEVAQPDDAPPLPDYDERPDYEPSEIENSSVASYILELRRAGMRIEDRKLLERPTEENLRYDETVLRRLGAIPLHDDGMSITEIGLAMTDLGLDPAEARMVVEARNYTDQVDGTYTDAVRLQVAAAVSVQQVNGMLDTGPGTKKRYMGNGYLKPLSNEQSSDFLFELDVFTELLIKQCALEVKGTSNWEKKFDNILEKYDILPNRYYKARRIFEELCRREEIESQALVKATHTQRAQIIDCQIVAAPELFVQRGKRTFTDIRSDRGRMLNKNSTINTTLGGLVVGEAFNFRGLNKNGRYERRSISAGSEVSIERLVSKLPYRISKQSLGLGVNRRGKLVERRALFFDGELKFADIEGELPPTVETRRELIKAMMTGMAPDVQKSSLMIPFQPGTPRALAAIKTWKYAQTVEERSGVSLNIQARHRSLIEKVVRESLEKVPLEVTDAAALDDLIPRVFVNALVKPSRRKRILPGIFMTSPDGISIHINDEDKEYIPVSYKNNIAYVSIPRDRRFSIKREDFAKLAEHHDVKIRIANGRYAHLDTMFERTDGEREAEARRRQRRAERQAEMSEASVRAKQKEERTLQQQREQEERDKTRQVLSLTRAIAKAGSNRKQKKLGRYFAEVSS